MAKTLKYLKINGLRIFCNECKRTINNSSTSKCKCNHPIEKQVYKAVIKIANAGGKKRTRILKSLELDDAIIELLDFKKEVNNDSYGQTDRNETPQLLIECIAMYIDYINDNNVPYHLKKHLSKSYIKTIKSFLNSLLYFLEDNGYNMNILKIEKIDDDVVGEYSKYLERKQYKNPTYNSKIKSLRTFYNYLIEEKDYSIKNVWKKVTLKSIGSTDKSINTKDFKDLLDIVTPEDSISETGKTRRNMYKPWLREVYLLKAFTGRRNAELFEMKWNMINFENGKPVYIKSPNIKLNKQQNNFNENDLEYVYVPVGEELRKLLNTIGLQNKKGSNEYLIAPEIVNRTTIENQASKSFTFFFKKLNKVETQRLRSLRKTYVTKEYVFVTSGISMQHNKHSTTYKHYVDRKEIAKEMVKKGFRIFNIEEEIDLSILEKK